VAEEAGPDDQTAGLAALNELPDDAAGRALDRCLNEPRWVAAMLAGRPFPDRASLLAAAHRLTVGLDDAGLTVALAGHPRIGELTGPGVSSAESAHSAAEQSGVDAADAQLADELRAANLAYEQRFDRVFLIRAAGRGGPEILAAARERLTHDDATEARVVREQLAEIAQLRLGALLADLAGQTAGSR
jgi:2-oxo-4-hydroxy-4-carboxy-5-ureidoimidazoline decarboxylase